MRQLAKPDLHKPRVRRHTQRIINQAFYRKFERMFPDLCLSRKNIRQIIDCLHELFKQVICTERDGLELPEQLGSIVLTVFKTRKDPNQSLAWDTDLYRQKIVYCNSETKYRFKNANLWAFSPVRDLERRAKAAFKKNHKKFRVNDNKWAINREFRIANKRLREKLKNKS